MTASTRYSVTIASIFLIILFTGVAKARPIVQINNFDEEANRQNLNQTSDATIFYRSEYEEIGDEIHDFDHELEGSVTYHITSGNEGGHYALDQTTGKLTIAQTIPDQFDVVTQHDLMIELRDGDAIFVPSLVSIVDGYDYQISLGGYSQILSEHRDTSFNGEWTAYNNLWGKGDAVPNQDFRTAMLITDSMPQQTIFLWDTPGKAAEFNGSSVWNYINLFYGNRVGEREDLPNFPFRIEDMASIPMNFNYEQLFGDDRYKVAFNMFLTDEETLEPFGSNDGDFFMVFDQVGTWVPPYPVDLGDVTIGGFPFTRLYKEDGGYEWRRVIITDDNSLTNAAFDLLDYFDMFADVGYLDKAQSISHMMFGLEITEGFGALQVNELSIDAQTESEAIAVDVNCDDQWNLIDVILIKRFNVFLISGTNDCEGVGANEALYEPACDLNNDQKCGLIDAVIVQQCNAFILNDYCLMIQ